MLGVGATVAAYYYYRKNQPQVDDFLRRQGIELPDLSIERDITSLSLEDLVREKERLEDLIAEREQQPAQTGSAPAPVAHAPAEPEPAQHP